MRQIEPKPWTHTPLMGMWNSALNNEKDPDSNGKLITNVHEKQDDQNIIQSHRTEQTATYPKLKKGGASPTAPLWQEPTLDASGRFVAQYVESEPGKQKSTTANQVLSYPRLENEISHLQLKIGALRDQMRQTLSSFQADQTKTLIENELSALDQEIRGIQLNYLHTFLISPIDGVITAIYKDVGESVESGEPVARVEDDGRVFIVGQINSREILHLGQDVTVNSSNLYESGDSHAFPGKLVSVRGHSSDNDEWDVIVECENPTFHASQRRILPINYQFDRHNTTIAV